MFASRAGPVLGAALAAILLGVGAWLLLGAPSPPWVLPPILLAAALWVFFAVFFRDPEREVGAGIVSPADGRVRAIERVGDRVLISVFMNVTDVHVNRLPLDARVEGIDSAGSGHRPAYAGTAGHNVQRSYRLSSDLGAVEVVQITGLLARRLVSLVRVGDARLKGERFGMIVLGSRVDLWLPADRVRVVTQRGERVRAGVTCVAEAL